MKFVLPFLAACWAGAGAAADFSADTVKSGSYVYVPEGEVLEGGVVFAGAVIVVDGDVKGDVMAFGARVELNGNVDGDLLVCCATAVITGDVSGSIQCYAADLTATGDVGGAFSAAGAAVSLRGDFGGDVKAAGGATWLDGSFGGDVEVESGYLALGEYARIRGDVNYRAEELVRASGATIGGRLEELPEPVPEEEGERGFDFTWWAIKNLWSILAFFVLAAFIAWLRPAMLTAIPDRVQRRPVRSLLVGLAVLVAAPGAVLVLLATVVGAPSALILAATYATALFAAYVFAGVFLGRLLTGRIFKGRETPVLFSALIGIIILVAAGNIPFFNILLALAVWVFGLGGAALYVWERRTSPPGT